VDDAEKLIDGLRRQREKYGEIAAIAERQGPLLESGDLEALMPLIERKRALMEEIEAIKRDTGGLLQRWPELKPGLPAERVRAVEQVVEETRALLERILRLEEEGRSKVERGRGDKAEEIRQLQKQKRLRDAYGQKEEGESRYLDDKK
jgi:hypothetical protein